MIRQHYNAYRMDKQNLRSSYLFNGLKNNFFVADSPYQTVAKLPQVFQNYDAWAGGSHINLYLGAPLLDYNSSSLLLKILLFLDKVLAFSLGMFADLYRIFFTSARPTVITYVGGFSHRYRLALIRDYTDLQISHTPHFSSLHLDRSAIRFYTSISPDDSFVFAGDPLARQINGDLFFEDDFCTTKEHYFRENSL